MHLQFAIAVGDVRSGVAEKFKREKGIVRRGSRERESNEEVVVWEFEVDDGKGRKGNRKSVRVMRKTIGNIGFIVALGCCGCR